MRTPVVGTPGLNDLIQTLGCQSLFHGCKGLGMHSTRQTGVDVSGRNSLQLHETGSTACLPRTFARSSRAVWIALAALGLASFARLYAQESIDRAPAASVPMLDGSTGVATLLDKGRVLEQQNRWLEALAIYEEALHQHPEVEDVRQRYLLAEIHCDLDRRLADVAFQDFVATMSEAQALDMLNEIMLKIQTHYVQEPDWQQLAWRGTASLDIAVTKTPERSRYLSQATDGQINEFRHLLRDDVNKRQVASRRDVQNLAAYAAQIASRQLDMRPSAAIVEYCCGVVAALDRYSSYLTGNQLDDVYGQIEGNFVGLGIELKADEGQMRIVKVIPGGPAAAAGVLPGDRIVAIDGTIVNSVPMDQATEMLKGPIHSIVNVTLADKQQTLRTVRVRRDRVEVPSVEDVRIVDAESGVGYFKITSFQKTTTHDVDQALWSLHQQGMRSLIVDLRGNPGGLLTAAVETSDKFIADGTIVSTRGRSSREDFDYFCASNRHLAGAPGRPDRPRFGQRQRDLCGRHPR